MRHSRFPITVFIALIFSFFGEQSRGETITFPPSKDFSVETVATDLSNPMEMSIAGDLVFIAELHGNIKVVDLSTTDAMGMSRGYADARYASVGGGAGSSGIAVAGGKIISTGVAGAQSVVNCWGVTSATISGSPSRYVITLTDAIAVDDDMVLTVSGVGGQTPIIYNIQRLSDTTFEVYTLLTDIANTLPWSTTVWPGSTFNFTVHNAGL